MASKINVPSFDSPREGYKVYNVFRGIDASTDETQIDDSRSPWAINIISDSSGTPTKRLGWRTLATAQEGSRVNGIYTFVSAGKLHLLVHAGAAFYRMDADGTNAAKIMDGVTDQPSTAVYLGGKLYLFTGGEYLQYDGAELVHVRDVAYVPLTMYGAQPSGGGADYEKVNLLTPWRRNSFIADGTTTAYRVNTGKIDDGTAVTCTVNGAPVTAFTVNYGSGIITFTTAPSKPANEGTSNVEIKFSYTFAGNRDKIEKCTICTTFGYNSENRIFAAGNPDAAATEWYSGLNDPTYFPDQNFVIVGSSDFPIISFLKYQENLLILKRDNRQEACIWNQTSEMQSSGAVFPIKPASAGVGAIAPRTAGNLLDDPLFLSPRGVFAPVTTYSYNKIERSIQRRSARIDPRLTREPGIEKAFSTVWQGYYILAVNGGCYVADGNQARAGGGYEWYYWDNIPATCFATELDRLYFGTADGRVCRFNDDLVDENGEILMRAYNDDGAAIRWEWRSKLDDFGSPSRLKTLDKRGNAVHLKAFTNGQCEIWLRTEKDFGKRAMTALVDRMNFNDVDFKRFTFNCLKDQTVVFKLKAKKFKRIQIILKGAAESEGFGVYAAALHYIYGDYAKARRG